LLTRALTSRFSAFSTQSEADIAHRTVCKHVRNFPGVWLNSNMLDHEAMDCQQEYDVVDVVSPDGSNSRKIGLCAVLSDDPALYSHFKAPGAFGGATITDPWKALTKYQQILEQDEGCDFVLPLQHLYVPDDHRTCREFDFPVILSGTYREGAIACSKAFCYDTHLTPPM